MSFMREERNMRTRVKGVKTAGLGLKRLATFMVAATIMVSCGKNNTSGTTTDQADNWNTWGDGYTLPGGTYGSGNGNQLPGNWMNVVSQENPCYQGGQRSTAQLELNINANAGGAFVGVTSYGDIAVVANQNGRTVATMYICPRYGLTGQGQFISQPVIESSPYCPIGQVSNLDVQLGSQAGQPYYLAFRPIHIPGTGYQSSLCSNQYY